MTEKFEIDLNDASRADGIKFLNDQDRGRADAQRLKVADVFSRAAAADKTVLVIVPNDLYGVATSYVNGLFSYAIDAVGVDKVLEHLAIDAPDHIVMSIVTSLRIWKEALSADLRSKGVSAL